MAADLKKKYRDKECSKDRSKEGILTDKTSSYVNHRFKPDIKKKKDSNFIRRKNYAME